MVGLNLNLNKTGGHTSRPPVSSCACTRQLMRLNGRAELEPKSNWGTTAHLFPILLGSHQHKQEPHACGSWSGVEKTDTSHNASACSHAAADTAMSQWYGAVACAKNYCPPCTGAGGEGGGHLSAGGDRIIHQLGHALRQAGQAHGPAVDRRLAQRMALAHGVCSICGRPRKRLILALLQQARTPWGAAQKVSILAWLLQA